MSRSPDSPGILVPPPLLFLAGFAAGIGLDAALGLARRPAPEALAWAVTLLGATLGGWGAVTFLRQRTGILPHTSATTVVTSGPYRFTRNPMYLGLALVYLGAALGGGRIGPLLLLLPTMALAGRLLIAREERYLAAKFGTAYTDYQQRVRRWL